MSVSELLWQLTRCSVWQTNGAVTLRLREADDGWPRKEVYGVMSFIFGDTLRQLTLRGTRQLR